MPNSAPSPVSAATAGQKVLVFSPHPDDESIAVGGYIAQSIENGADVRIVLVTNGDWHHKEAVRYAEFKKATGILGGLWEKVREQPREFLDMRTVEEEGLDAAARDFLAGMTDRYAVNLFENLFIPKPWVGPLVDRP